MSRAVVFWLAVLLVFSGSSLVWFGGRYIRATGSYSEPDPIDASNEEAITEFELVDQTGKVLHSRELDGQVWVGSFFFSRCPSKCFNQNSRLYELQKHFADQGIRLQMISITCDPTHDTPDELARYASRFLANPQTWRFLTPSDGDTKYVQRIGNDFFGLPIADETHSDQVVVFDRQGQSRGTFSVLNAEQLTQLKQLLADLLGDESEASGQPTSRPSADA